MCLCVCVSVLKICELSETLLSCVTLLEIAGRVGWEVDVPSGWMDE